MSDPRTFLHEGIKITVDERARFVATCQGQNLTAPSLDAMKKKIDKLGAKFEPFQGWIVRSTDPTQVTIIGVKPNSRRGSNHRGEWVTSGRLTLDHIVRDTPEVRVMIEALVKLHDENEKVRDAMERAEYDAITAIQERQERP